eukprot:scaffold35599_cov52-Phaeocystis_antarctica.AAC.2
MIASRRARGRERAAALATRSGCAPPSERLWGDNSRHIGKFSWVSRDSAGALAVWLAAVPARPASSRRSVLARYPARAQVAGLSGVGAPTWQHARLPL